MTKYAWGDELRKRRVINDPSLIDAFNKVARDDFLPQDQRHMADVDTALPIGFDQTMSSPLVVALTLKWLHPKPSHLILDVGSGSGWTTALLSELVGSSGQVIGVEIVSELVKFGQKNIKKYNFKNVKIIKAKKGIGLLGKGPYDRILVSAAGDKSMLEELLLQLKDPGILVMPIKPEANASKFRSVFDFYNQTVYVVKKQDGHIKTTKEAGFVFVPLIRGDD